MTPDLYTLTQRRRELEGLAMRYGSLDALPQRLLDDLAEAIHTEVVAQITNEVETTTTRRQGREEV